MGSRTGLHREFAVRLKPQKVSPGGIHRLIDLYLRNCVVPSKGYCSCGKYTGVRHILDSKTPRNSQNFRQSILKMVQNIQFSGNGDFTFWGVLNTPHRVLPSTTPSIWGHGYSRYLLRESRAPGIHYPILSAFAIIIFSSRSSAVYMR